MLRVFPTIQGYATSQVVVAASEEGSVAVLVLMPVISHSNVMVLHDSCFDHSRPFCSRRRSGNPDVLSAIAALLVTTAWCLSFVEGFGCENVRFKALSNNPDLPDIPVGIWNTRGVEYLGIDADNQIVVAKSCDSYPDYVDEDYKWKSAMASSLTCWRVANLLP
jgi:hypothetical protein